MNRTDPDVAMDYARGLARYLDAPSEQWLEFAYELGRRGVQQRLGILDLIVAHESALHRLMASETRRHAVDDIVVRAGIFLSEALGPFEMAYRGYQDANVSLLALNDRMRAQTRNLEESNADLDAFAHSIAHDLRAPLRAMVGFGQALIEEETPKLEAPERSYASRIVEAARRMDAMIVDLLEYSRVSRGELQLAAVDLSEVVTEAMVDVRAELEDRNTDVRVSPTLGVAWADAGLLRRAVANLIGNGSKFVAEEVRPAIEIRSERTGDRVRLSVTDNGIGIPVEHQDRIFRMLERLQPGDFAGTGIGLTIVRRAVERMNGTVSVTSAPNEGSTFSIELGALPPPM